MRDFIVHPEETEAQTPTPTIPQQDFSQKQSADDTQPPRLHGILGQTQDAAEQALQERAENNERYRISVDDETYKQFNKIIANSDNPEETAYKIGTAQKYAEMLDMPLVDAYANLDTLNREYWGEHTTAKGAFKSVVDMLTVGKNNVKIGNLGNKLVDAEKRGDTELVEKLLAEIEAVENESAAYMDNGTPRAWITSTLQAGAQSLPYTGAGVGAAMFGAFIGGAGGAIAAGFGASTYLARGQEYVEMRKKGIRPEIARNVSLVDGAIQGGIETALDFTLGVVGKNIAKATKGLRGNITSAVSEKISNTIAKKIHFGSGLKIATNWLVHGTMNTASEGAEEFLQQTTGDVSQNVAISAENKARAEELKQALSTLEGEYSEALEDELKKAYPQLEEMTLKEIVKDSANAFVEGAKGALALGIFNAGLSGTMRSAKIKSAKGFIDPYGNVEEYLQIRKMSENVKSEEMFSNAVKDSAVFEGMNDEQKAKIVKQIFAEGQARAAEAEAKTRADIEESKDTADNAEASPVDETGERAGKAREYRTETGGLYTEEDTQRRADADDDGKAHGRLLLGDPTRQSLLKDDGNRYGYINYTVDGDNVTIDDFKMTAGREKLSREFFEDFAEKFAGKNIEWNPKHETNIKLKNEIIQNNPNGKGAGLNYFSADTIEDNRARIQIAKTIRENTKNWSDEQVSAGTALLTSAAKAKGVKLADFVNNYFHNGQVITNKESDVSNIAQAAAQHGATMENVFGATQLDKAGRAIIYIGEHGDFNTFSHELGHFFRKTCLDGEALSNAEKEFGVDQNTHQWTTAQEEAFADGFTDYLRTGKAKTKGLESLYKKIAEFIADVFRGLQGQIKLNDNIKAVYDSLLEDDGSGLARARKAVESAKAQEIAEKRAAKEQAQKESEQKKAEEEAKKTDAEKASEKAERVIADYSATTAEKAQAVIESATENARAVMDAKEKKAEAEKQNQKGNGHAKRLRDNFKKATAELVGTQLKNESTGTQARFTSGSRKELSSRTINSKENGFTLAEHFEAINKIDELFKNATLEKVHDDIKNGKPDIKIERFLSKEIELSTGKTARACITVKHTQDINRDIRTIYSLELMDTKKALEQTRAKGKRRISGEQPSNEILAQQNSDVNNFAAEKEVVRLDIKKHALEMTSSAVGWANSESLNETTREPLNSFTDKILAQQNSVVNNFVEENELLFQLVGKRGFSNLMQHFSHIAGTSHDIKERTFANNLKNNLLQFGVMKQNGELNQSTKYAENGRINVNLFSFSKQGDALLKAFSTGNALKGLDEKAKEKIFAIGGIKRTENGQYHIELPLQKLLLESDGKENETGKYLFTAYPELKNVTVQFGHLQGLKKDISSIGVLSYLSEHNKIVVTLENKEYSDAEKAQVISMAKQQISKQIDAIIQNIEADAEKREAFIDYVKQSKNLIAGLLEKRPDLNPQEIREQLKTNAIYKEAVKAAQNEYSAPILFQISKETKQNIDDVITAANSGNNEKFERILGSVTPKLAEIAKAHGYNIDGYFHSLDNYFINHQRKQHGDAKKEANRGQIAITDDDIRNIPNVLANSDFIIYGSKVKNGNPAITFVQNQENATVFVEEVRTGKKRLSAQTIYKTARTFDVSSIKDARELYAQSDPSTISIVDVKNEIVNSERRESPLFQIIGEMGAERLDASEEVHEGKTRLENLAIAKQMQKEGKDAKAIRLATGWEKGARKWRYEIGDDANFKIVIDEATRNQNWKKYNALKKQIAYYDNLTDEERAKQEKKVASLVAVGMLDDGATFSKMEEADRAEFKALQKKQSDFILANTLSEIVDAPELFRAYPQLKDITVEYICELDGEDERLGGYYDKTNNKIVLRNNVSKSEIKSTLLHEIQHAIQDIEGFSRGGSIESFETKDGLSAYEQYRRIAGEVEARNVQKRIDFTPEERLATLLAETEDVAKKDQIILDKATAAYCQSVENAEKIGEALKAFDENAEPMQKVEYSLAEYKKLFPRGEAKTPIGKVKLGEHQFERLAEKDGGARKNLIGAMYQTLTNPIAIIEDTDKQGRKAKLFIKSFIDDEKKKATFAIVVKQDDIEVSVSFGLRKEKQVRNKIKMASRFYYVAATSPTIGTVNKTLPNSHNSITESGNVNSDGKKVNNVQIKGLETAATNLIALQTSQAEKIPRVESLQTRSLGNSNSSTLFQFVNNEEELFNEAKKYKTWEEFRDAQEAEDTTSHYKAADIEEPVDIEQFAKESEAVLNAKSEELQRLDSEIADLEARAEIYGDAFLDAEYLQELQDERRVLEADIAGNFNFGDMEENAKSWLSDTDARNAFYKTIWESAKEAAEKEEYSDENRKAAYIQAGGDETEAAESEKDRQFYDFISKDEYALSQFLKEVAYIAKEANREITDDNRPSDEEELAMYEEKQRLLDRYDKELRHGAFRYAVSQALKSLDNSKKVELTERQHKTILTLIKNNKRDYRDIYADFMNESDWSVEEGYRAGDKLAVRIMSPDFNAEDYTPEERKRIADKLDFKDLKRELKNGSMRMELETVQKLANGFENEIEEIREEKKVLEKKIEDNAEASADETRRLKYLHEKELEKIDKREQAREVQKLKVKLLKSITRKVRFDAVNYEEGQKIIAIQQLFTPQLEKYVDSFLNSEEPYLRDALSQYKVSYDYRRRLQALAQRTGGGSGIRKMIKIFDTKPFEKWTEEDKRIVARYLPRTDWIKELDLEELTKRNKSVLRFDLQSEETQKLLADLLPPDLLSLVTNEKMKDWTLDDVEELAGLVDDLRREGREKLRQKKEVEIARAEKLRDRIEREILSNGLHIDEDDTPEEKERKQKAIEKFKKEKLPKILGIGAATKGTLKASQEKQSAFKRLLHGYGDMNMKRFARMLDNGESGINTTLLVDQENDCFNKEHSAIFERSCKIEQVLKDNGLKVEDLSKIVEVDFGGEKQEYTIDELLYFRAASKDEKSRYAVMCGNMFDETIKAAYRQTPEKQQAYLRMCKVKFKNVLNAAEKVLDDNPALADFANAIAEDYSEQYGRMNEICIKEFNTPMGRVDCYVPLVRLESNGDTNENKIKADMLGATGSTANNNVDDGMRKQRVDISPANQKPVEVGLYKTWCKSLNRTEHFIAYAPYIRELHRVYTGRDGAKMRQYIENRYGQGALQYIKDYINEVANPDVSSSLSELDRVVRALRGKTAPAYLGWKISGIIKQACTSPFPFMQYASPAEYGRAVFDFLRHKEMREAIKAKSAYMNSRVFDPMIDLLKEQEEKETKPLFAKYDAFLKMGMQGLEAVDWYCVAPGWLAVYRKELQKLNSAEAKQARYDRAYKAEIAEAKAQYGDLASLGDMQLQIEADARAAAEAERDISEDEIEKRAVAKADEITRMCQPSARLADLSPLFKERGKGSELSRAFLQFTTSLNVIWQNIRYDLPNALKRKQWKQAIGTLTGYVLAGVLVGMVSEGLPEPTGDDDKDKEKRLRKIAYYSITQFTDSIPILGNIATNTAERLVAGENKYQGNSDLFPIISKIQNGLYAAEREDYLKALSNFGLAAGLAAGVPVSGLKEAGYTVGIGDGDGKLQPHPTAILGRRPKAEKEKK